MDMTFFHIDLLQELYCLFEKTKHKQKEAGVAHFFKKNTIITHPNGEFFLISTFLPVLRLGSIIVKQDHSANWNQIEIKLEDEEWS